MGTGATVATLADASELPTTVTVAQVNYSAVADGEVRKRFRCAPVEVVHGEIRRRKGPEDKGADLLFEPM